MLLDLVQVLFALLRSRVFNICVIKFIEHQFEYRIQKALKVLVEVWQKSWQLLKVYELQRVHKELAKGLLFLRCEILNQDYVREEVENGQLVGLIMDAHIEYGIIFIVAVFKQVYHRSENVKVVDSGERSVNHSVRFALEKVVDALKCSQTKL